MTSHQKRSRTKPSQSQAESSLAEAEATLLSLNYLGSFSEFVYKALYFPILYCCPEGYSIVAKTSAFDEVLISISGWN